MGPKGNVHPGSERGGDGFLLDATVEVGGTPGQGEPVFGGAFCQGPQTGRFLYVSWKREGNQAAPWAWRIKVPLSGITWPMIETAARPGWCLLADIGDRRPHMAAPVAWQVARSD